MDAPGFYFCLCPDPFLAREHVDNLLAQLAASGTSVNARTWWADDGLDSQFWESLTLQGLGESSRALLVRGAQSLPAEVWKKLSAQLATPRTGILPVFFLENGWEKGQPKLPAHIAKLRCLEFASKQSWTWRSPGLDSRSLRRHVREKATAMGLTFTGEALESLCNILAPDAAAIQGVLEQLFLAAFLGPDGSRVVDVDLARQMTAHTPEILIFDFIRHLQDGDASAVWTTLRSEGDGGESLLFPLLALLARESRLLWQILAGENVYLPQHIAGTKRALASRLGRAGLAHLFASIMEAEWSVKSGRRQPLQALEELTADLTIVFQSAPRGRNG